MTGVPFGQTVTVIRGAVNVRTGQWEEASRHDIAGCAVAVGASAETTGTSDTLTVDATVYAPVGADVTATDRVLIGSAVYDVQGQPWAPVNPFTGWAPGVVVSLVHHEG